MSTLSSIEQSCSDWSQLPVDVLTMLAKKINSIEDLYSFGGVCSSWRCVTLSIRKHKNKTPPWLMLTADCGQGYRDFYSVAENKTYRSNLPQTFLGQQSYGSPFGWLFNVRRSTGECHLFNPFSPTRCLPLPLLRKCPGRYYDIPNSRLQQYVFKAAVFQFSHSTTTVVKDHDNHNQFLVFAIHGVHKNLAYCRSGDDTWTEVTFPDTPSSEGQLDILHLNGRFYSVDSHGNIWLLCDVASGGPNSPTAIPFASPPPMFVRLKNSRCAKMFSLIEMEGELHVAVRFQHPRTRKTCLIEIFKLDPSSREWQKLNTLGDYALFLGTSTSTSVKASEFSANDCEPGNIYFCYAEYDIPAFAPSDIGIINIDRHAIGPLNVNVKPTQRYSLPAWVTPKLL